MSTGASAGARLLGCAPTVGPPGPLPDVQALEAMPPRRGDPRARTAQS